MFTTITALTLASAFFAPIQEDPQESRWGGRGPAPDDARVQERMESKLGFTIYEPKALDARMLVKYAGELAETKVEFFYESATTGQLEVGRRARFIVMNDVIGVQDFAIGREAAVRILADLDERLGAARTDVGAQQAAPKPQLRTVRLRALDMQTAMNLVNNVAPYVMATPVNETGTLVLQGSVADVGRAETLIKELDQPLPQMTMRCRLIQAIDTPNPDEDPPSGLLPETDPVAQSLGQVVPNKRFRNVGNLLLRGSAGGNAGFEVTSTLLGLSQDDEKAPARVIWSGVARGLDPETKVLTLDRCQMLLELPTFQTTSNGRTTQTNFAGYRTEGLTANLALRADETTVVGSIGGNPIYLSMSFTIED